MDENTRHAEKMKKRKAVQDAEVASKTVEKGLLIVHTGPVRANPQPPSVWFLRALGAGLDVGVVQFIKGAWETGERRALAAFGERIVWRTMGEGFTWRDAGQGARHRRGPRRLGSGDGMMRTLASA